MSEVPNSRAGTERQDDRRRSGCADRLALRPAEVAAALGLRTENERHGLSHYRRVRRK